MKLFFILWMMLAISYAQTHLSPISAATAQTFGTFHRGMDAVGGNPANLAYKSKKNTSPIIHISHKIRRTILIPYRPLQNRNPIVFLHY